VHIFGPFAMVAAVGSAGRATRAVQVGDRTGTEFPVDVPTHVSAIARFASGRVSQSVFSFESPLTRMGVVDTRPLASGALGYHVLDTLMAIDEAITSGQAVNVTSTVDPVPLVADDWDPFAATL
jgi:hypothetical protein